MCIRDSIKEVLDNSIDEYVMGHGKQIDLKVADGEVVVRDYGRGIPLGKVVDVVSKMNTGGKYDSKAFKKSVGLNGVGLKAVNALSTEFVVKGVRDGKAKTLGGPSIRSINLSLSNNSPSTITLPSSQISASKLPSATVANARSTIAVLSQPKCDMPGKVIKAEVSFVKVWPRITRGCPAHNCSCMIPMSLGNESITILTMLSQPN